MGVKTSSKYIPKVQTMIILPSKQFSKVQEIKKWWLTNLIKRRSLMTISTFSTLTKTQRGKITQMGGTEKLIEN